MRTLFSYLARLGIRARLLGGFSAVLALMLSLIHI